MFKAGAESDDAGAGACEACACSRGRGERAWPEAEGEATKRWAFGFREVTGEARQFVYMYVYKEMCTSTGGEKKENRELTH